jgi:hypothetical protein
MRHISLVRSAVVLAALTSVAAVGAAVGCGPNPSVFWVCLNPITGKDDGSIYDANHYVDGVIDPCHCYDPCGPEKTCPITVDAGPPPADAMCEAGDEDAGDGG